MVIAEEKPPLQMGEGGSIRVGGTRVTLDTIVIAHQLGSTPEQIAADYPAVTLADIYSVVGYYLRHQADVDEYLRRREVEAAEIRATHEKNCPPQITLAELLARKAARGVDQP